MNERVRQRVVPEMVRVSAKESSRVEIARGPPSLTGLSSSREACVRPMRLEGWKNVKNCLDEQVIFD
jgi:hypothetical protein